jgi:aminoglycoside 6'-N-acetyltransferase
MDIRQLVLRPLVAGDAAELRRIHATPEVARWWDAPHDGFPVSDDPDATGTEAVRRVVRHLSDERGHHRITIDPAPANAAAIRAYEKLGSVQSV